MRRLTNTHLVWLIPRAYPARCHTERVAGDSSSGATPHLVPGYRLDRYELLCPIAEGGMASVWVARLRAKHGFEKLVAIKTILPKHAEDPRFQEMFLDEARIASKIDHVNVAHVIDLGDDHGVLYLVMEWVEGDSLSKLERAIHAGGHKMPLGIALRIVADVCAGLEVAHELRGGDGKLLGVVHRDVSPQNILVSASGNVKVIDFGIAKARDRVAGDTSTGSLKGKIQFMSPEQALGKVIDRRADIWSTGSVLYHLLAGVPPYDGSNQYAMLHRIASGERPTPLPPGLPPAVVALVEKALAYNPNERFATMGEMRVDVEAALEELSTSVTSKDVAELASKYLSSRAEQRRKSIAIALHAATERDRVTKLLVAPDSDSEPALPPQIDALARSRMPTIPDMPTAIERTSTSSRSFGAASIPTIPPRPPSSWRRGSVLGTAVALALLLVFVVGRVTGARALPPRTTSGTASVAIAPVPAPLPASDPSAVSPPLPSAGASASPLIVAPSPPAPLASGSSKRVVDASPRSVPRTPPRGASPPHPSSNQKLPIDDGF
jgi:serine/threonine protein kinase